MPDPTPTDAAALAFHDHDHLDCAADTLARAEAIARDHGARMTPVRRRVLQILLESHSAMGAYEILDRLGAEGFGNQPPVAYRALDFLVEQGLVHRIQRLNAFTACLCPGESHSPMFLICRACNRVAESSSGPFRDALAASAMAIGFQIERTTVEAVGLCPACAQAPA
ncbi:Fur family transcriptional regulator [Paracoccus pacificus]|uniref:Fur family transcriptional regulator n=1 Tax=Paracoccus pacificus TaxID=1463598 RepID=A0ABW4RB21_9RHOB